MVDAVAVPVVASGGAGNPEHLRAVLAEAGASAALAASIFHYRHYSISETKEYLASRGVPVRLVDAAEPRPLLAKRIAISGESAHNSDPFALKRLGDRGQSSAAQVVFESPARAGVHAHGDRHRSTRRRNAQRARSEQAVSDGDEIQGLRSSFEGRHGPRHAAGRRAAADAASAAVQQPIWNG